jgi:prepilin-type processing-associated H-X9-DG protein
MSTPRPRPAFTLVELLVIMVLIAVLIGLLLPAAQKVRDTANRMSCQNNLKQMGIALVAFNNAKGRLPAALINSGRVIPSGVMQWTGKPTYQGPEVNYIGQPYVVYNHTGFVALLPFLEQDNLFKQYRYDVPSSTSNIFPTLQSVANNGDDSPNSRVIGTLVKVYACPADNYPPEVVTTAVGKTGLASAIERNHARRSNYLLNVGGFNDASLAVYTTNQTYATNIVQQGPFGVNGAASLSTVRDGTGNTIAIGESKQDHSQDYGPFWGCGAYGAVLGAVPTATKPPLPNPNLLAPKWNINNPYNLCPGQKAGDTPLCQGPGGFGSWHLGGANFVFCDGSVHFLSDNIDYTVLQYLSTATGGDIVSVPD